MKFLFDENLSPGLVDLLKDLFPGSSHVHNCGLGAARDAEIWQYAVVNEFAIVSKDIDFAERAVREEHMLKVVWLRIGNASVIDTELLIRRNAILIQHFAEHENDTLLVLGYPRRKSAK